MSAELLQGEHQTFEQLSEGRPAAKFTWKLREMDDRDKSLFHPSKVPPGVFLDDFPLQ